MKPVRTNYRQLAIGLDHREWLMSRNFTLLNQYDVMQLCPGFIGPLYKHMPPEIWRQYSHAVATAWEISETFDPKHVWWHSLHGHMRMPCCSN